MRLVAGRQELGRVFGEMTTHSERYTGRGLHWAKKPITKRRSRRIARYRMGLVIESVLAADWTPDDLERRYGREGLEEIRDQMLDLAKWLESTGHPDGRSSRS